MRKHNGMRPQDIVILLKIVALGEKPWQSKDLAWALHISASEVSDSLNRSSLAGLIDPLKKEVFRQSLMEFLEYGLHYVFPEQPGGMVNGIPTAHSHPFMRKHFGSEINYVWPDVEGNERGLKIEPLYPNVVKAVKEDDILYELLALIDVIRVGRTRERKIAVKELQKIILHELQH
jgi:hypothetical protein